MWMMNPLLPKIPGLAKNYYPPANHVDRAGAGQTAIGWQHSILQISNKIGISISFLSDLPPGGALLLINDGSPNIARGLCRQRLGGGVSRIGGALH
jgi:hypothetical protein